MKKIIFLILTILSLQSFSQDSARLKINVVFQARDCEVLLSFTPLNRKFDDLDSVLLAKFRPPAVAPTGNTSVSIDNIEARVLLEAWRICYDHAIIVAGGTADRVGSVLKASGHSWLVNKVIAEEDARNALWTALRKIGREYGKKETTGFEN